MKQKCSGTGDYSFEIGVWWFVDVFFCVRRGVKDECLRPESGMISFEDLISHLENGLTPLKPPRPKLKGMIYNSHIASFFPRYHMSWIFRINDHSIPEGSVH